MFSPKDYILVCHGCGSFHSQRAEFLSAPGAIAFEVDGGARTWTVPTLGCPACMATPRDPERPREHPIARAFDKGMTREARGRADLAFRAHWRGVLEARKAAR